MTDGENTDSEYLKTLRHQLLGPKRPPVPVRIEIVKERMTPNMRVGTMIAYPVMMVLQYLVLLWTWPVIVKFGAPELTWLELFKLDLAVTIVFPALASKSRRIASDITLEKDK